MSDAFVLRRSNPHVPIKGNTIGERLWMMAARDLKPLGIVVELKPKKKSTRKKIKVIARK